MPQVTEDDLAVTHSMKKLTLTKAFAQFGAELENPRWQCSALAKDGSVVVSCWSHLLMKFGPEPCMRYEYSATRWGEGNRLGRRLLWTHLQMAIDQNLPVRLVVATLANPNDTDNETTDASPLPKTFTTDQNLVGRVVQFDGEQFSIECR